MSLILVMMIFLCSTKLCTSSLGDIDPNYKLCCEDCYVHKMCSSNSDHSDAKLKEHLFGHESMHGLFAAYYRYVTPDCLEICKYECSWKITSDRLIRNLPQLKYYGHWVFRRPYGYHEPASAFFSLCNALPHFLQINKRWSSKPVASKTEEFYLKIWMVPYPYVAAITWTASTLYHSRRTFHSHKFDLVTALLLIFYGLLLSIRRILGPFSSGGLLKYPWILFSAGAFMLLTWRLHAMFTDTITFEQHMEAAIAMATVSCFMWIAWCLFSYDENESAIVFNLIPYGGSRQGRKRMLIFQVWFIAAAMMEIFDFPPIFQVFDAHSLWHACTVPLGFYWYQFIDEDGQFYERKGKSS